MTRKVAPDLMNPSDPLNISDLTMRERERHFAVISINNKIKETYGETEFTNKRIGLALLSIVLLLIGTLFVLWGFALTDVFQNYKLNWGIVSIGVLLLLLSVISSIYMVFPNKSTRERIKQIKANQIARKKSTNFMETMAQARFATEVEKTKLSLQARLGRKIYKVKAVTLGQFMENVQLLTGLPVDQQLIKFQGKQLELDLERELVFDMGFQENDIIDVYNKGGYESYINRTNATGYQTVAGSRAIKSRSDYHHSSLSSMSSLTNTTAVNNKPKVSPLKETPFTSNNTKNRRQSDLSIISEITVDDNINKRIER